MRKKQNSLKKVATKKVLDVVYLHVENKRRLESLHEEIQLANAAIKFHPFAESIITDFLNMKESQKKFTHPIEFKAIVDQHIVLMDNVSNKPVLVDMDDAKKLLHCDSCNLDNCHHVGFAYGNSTVCNILMKKEFFPSRNVG